MLVASLGELDTEAVTVVPVVVAEALCLGVYGTYFGGVISGEVWGEVWGDKRGCAVSVSWRDIPPK